MVHGIGQADQLLADAVDQHDLDREAAEHGDVRHDVREVLMGHDRTVDRDDEHVVAEHRDVAEDSPQVGGLHGALALAGHANPYGLRAGGGNTDASCRGTPARSP